MNYQFGLPPPPYRIENIKEMVILVRFTFSDIA